jgi:hypothetical protein
MKRKCKGQDEEAIRQEDSHEDNVGWRGASPGLDHAPGRFTATHFFHAFPCGYFRSKKKFNKLCINNSYILVKLVPSINVKFTALLPQLNFQPGFIKYWSCTLIIKQMDNSDVSSVYSFIRIEAEYNYIRERQKSDFVSQVYHTVKRRDMLLTYDWIILQRRTTEFCWW